MDNSRICSITTRELGVGQSLARRWFSKLVAAGLARRAQGRKNGTLLFSPLARDFLLWRKGQSGHPPISLEKVLSVWLRLKEHGHPTVTKERMLWEISISEGTQTAIEAQD